MEKMKPKLFSVMKGYTKEQFIKDVVAGIIVAIIALPLSIALALASGVGPEQGLYTAITAGFVISFLGGSRVQISGPTAAFASIVAGVVARAGMEGLILATILAGIILILFGILRFGSLLKYIPYTITTGFTAGIAVTILIGQIKDFLGLQLHSTPIETLEKLHACFTSIHTLNYQALFIGIVSLFILIVWPKINQKIPASLTAVIIASVLVKFFHMQVNTIGSLYEISNKLPTIQLPVFSFKMVRNVLPDAFTIAILAGIESLLSCVVADGMIGSKHRSNMELIAQGAGNITSALFGGIPATGAIARTAANVKNGGRTPIAGMVHSITLLLILVVLMPYASFIPMPAIAAILFVVAYNMSEWRVFIKLVKTAPKSDIIVLVATFVLTIVFDLVVAIEIGIVLTALLFMKRMSDVTQINGWKYIDEEEEENENDPERILLREVPKNTLVYEVVGPMFFAAAYKFFQIPTEKSVNAIILRMKGVPAMDATALKTLQEIHHKCQKNHITLIFSHIQDQPLSVIKKAGFDKVIQEENICSNIDIALKRAATLGKTKGSSDLQ
ncbi:SulP family inorganic anion transporter [Candidatus Galacturonibacter soehngenii]|uniref:STAS domain-containing protein n=1 Tax=Candidatus Galacturonatibacter soehngenii TaxID=2307010 RepID=A0A7V7QMT1_9FIRM|nr:SulP family inorganic anion transporter [Candidatus Galacturonibacter soehngenii]KAB1439623.1 STAS domain-containing protein [Candidatus Galacturonibacter soehngenii]